MVPIQIVTQQESDNVVSDGNKTIDVAKPEATSTSATSNGKTTEESKTSSDSEKIVDEEEQGSNGFAILFFIFVVVALSTTAFIKLGGMTWVSHMLRRARGPKYHRVDQDLEK